MVTILINGVGINRDQSHGGIQGKKRTCKEKTSRCWSRNGGTFTTTTHLITRNQPLLLIKLERRSRWTCNHSWRRLSQKLVQSSMWLLHRRRKHVAGAVCFRRNYLNQKLPIDMLKKNQKGCQILFPFENEGGLKQGYRILKAF